MTIDLKNELLKITDYWLETWQHKSPLEAITPTALPNVPFNTEDKTEFAELHVLSGDILRITFGSPDDNTNRHTGVIRIKVNVRINTGDARLLELASIASQNLSWKVFNGIRTRDARIYNIDNVGSWRTITIDVAYTTDYNF